MATAEQQTSSQAGAGSGDRSWHSIVLQTLKRNEISLIPYVPDRVLTPLIRIFMPIPSSRPLRPPARKRPSASSRAPGWAGGAARC